MVPTAWYPLHRGIMTTGTALLTRDRKRRLCGTPGNPNIINSHTFPGFCEIPKNFQFRQAIQRRCDFAIGRWGKSQRTVEGISCPWVTTYHLDLDLPFCTVPIEKTICLSDYSETFSVITRTTFENDPVQSAGLLCDVFVQIIEISIGCFDSKRQCPSISRCHILWTITRRRHEIPRLPVNTRDEVHHLDFVNAIHITIEGSPRIRLMYGCWL